MRKPILTAMTALALTAAAAIPAFAEETASDYIPSGIEYSGSADACDVNVGLIMGPPSMDSVPQEEWGRVLSVLSGEKKHYEKDQILWNVGNAVESLPVILKGSVAAYMVNGKGQEAEIGRFTDGSCFGEMLAVRGIPSPVMVKALEATDVVYLSKEKLHGKNTGNGDDMRSTFLWGVINNMAEKIGIVTDRLDMQNRTIADKFLAYLETMPEDEDGSRIMDRSLTELAEYFQVSRFSLSRELGVMEGKGLIRKTGSKTIKVLV